MSWRPDRPRTFRGAGLSQEAGEGALCTADWLQGAKQIRQLLASHFRKVCTLEPGEEERGPDGPWFAAAEEALKGLRPDDVVIFRGGFEPSRHTLHPERETLHSCRVARRADGAVGVTSKAGEGPVLLSSEFVA